jgi:hypothetical protein
MSPKLEAALKGFREYTDDQDLTILVDEALAGTLPVSEFVDQVDSALIMGLKEYRCAHQLAFILGTISAINENNV